MQTDAEPFLQRIRAFPDDDVPRLIFADWLEEQGGADAARAAFIRVQVALAGLQEDDPGRPALVNTEQFLLDAHRDEWETPFRGLATGLVFRRGFVEEVKVAARQYLRHANELFSAGPIRHIHLLDLGGSTQTIAQSTYLSRLSTLTIFAQHAGEPLVQALSRSPHLAGLRALHLGRNRLKDDAIEHLASSSAFASLEELDLAENDISEVGARALAASPHLAKLQRLDLRGNQVGPTGAEALAGSDRLTGLYWLGLARNNLGVPRLHSVARISDLLGLPALDLTENELTPAALKATLTRPAGEDWPLRLRELDLSLNDLGEPGARVLAEADSMNSLRSLRLLGCNVPDSGLRLIAYSPNLNRLTALHLGNNPLSEAGFRPFLETPFLRSLRKLIVPATGIGHRMIEKLNSRFHQGVTRF